MKKFFTVVYENIIGVITLTGMLLNTAFLFPAMMLGVLLRVISLGKLKNFFRKVNFKIADAWVSFNTLWLRIMHGKKWENPLQGLSKKDWNIIISNHNNWADIIILQALFDKKLPLLKFFIKKQLFWVPFMGLVWWGLEFPFMNRYSKEKIAKNPKLKNKDIETSRKVSQTARQMPTTIFNFPEGTRYTKEKAEQQNTPFKYLLKPKAGGIGMSLKTLNDKVNSLIDVTFIYKNNLDFKAINAWDFLCGRVKDVEISIRRLQLPDWIKNGDYEKDSEFKAKFQNWLNQIWQEKDELIASYFSTPTKNGEAK